MALRTGRRLISTVPIELDFSRGLVSDTHFAGLPPGTLWNCLNFLPHRQGAIIRRGGWTGISYPSSVSGQVGIGYLPSPKELGIVEWASTTARFWRYPIGAASPSLVGDIGAAWRTDSNLFPFQSGTSYVLLVPSDGTQPLKKYTSPSLPVVVGGSPPNARTGVAYKDRVWVASRDSSTPSRIFASALGNVDSWDTTYDWLDVDHPVTALAALPNALLVFSEGFSWRVTGSTPGAAPDLDRQPLGPVGAPSPRAVTAWESSVIVANPEGCYLTSGSGWLNLTVRGGISDLWHTSFSGFASSWHLAVGTFREFLFVSLTDNNGVSQLELVCHIPSITWWKIDNSHFWGGATVYGAQSELYAVGNHQTIIRFSSIFDPTTSNIADGNGVYFATVLETRPLVAGAQLQHYTDGWILYEMLANPADNPQLRVLSQTGLEKPGEYVSVPESPFPKTTHQARRRLTLAKVAESLSLRIDLTDAAAPKPYYLAIYGIQLRVRTMEPARERS